MFEKLKKIFSDTAKNLSQKSISTKEIDRILDELQINLMENDVALEIVEELTSKLKTEILNLKLERNENSDDVITAKFYSFLHDLFLSTDKKIDVIQSILEKKRSKSGPFSIIFLGINGTGKTTTIAKFCKLLRDHGISVVLAAADTHRAGAIEQLTQHGNNLDVRVISQRYGSDPSAVARDALEHAKKNYIDAVLIDTAGRMQTSKNLMEEVSKIIRVIRPDMKVFVGDSLSGNDTVNQAQDFFQYTNYDCSILTKSDADSKGGAAISIVYLTNKPILYLGVGQGYGDLDEFNFEKFLDSIFKNTNYDKDRDISENMKEVLFSNSVHIKSDKSQSSGSHANITNLETQTNEGSKLLKSEELTSLSPTREIDSTKIMNQKPLTPYHLDADTENSRRRKIDEMKGTKSNKGSILGNFFKDKETQKDVYGDKPGQKDETIEMKDKEKSKKAKNKNEVLYLTDDDINDLFE